MSPFTTYISMCKLVSDQLNWKLAVMSALIICPLGVSGSHIMKFDAQS